ncbi:hypothetical protein [Sphingopyxis flava]|uniref:Uncharacterized protein n=1 Tax=Sphingopyxis flava TaxID=1507287 RepID=A0A1T5AB72_9SPHN|nr:hypothetical protein [Sphingopyxis flava]SKB32271.1 hypothetical protein SAMN06295937_100359 [Sphingopyxis flava]
MGSLGYIVGGALQGIGSGMAQQAQSDAEERRQMALENLRQQNAQSNMRLQAELNDTNAAKSDARGDYYDARKTERGASVDAQSDARKFGYQVQLKKMDFANDIERTRLESALAQGRDAATLQLRAQIERGEIRQIVESGDGQYYAIRGDGSQIATGVKVPPKAMEDGTGSIANARAARGGGGIGSAAATAPAKPAPSPAPAKPAAKPAAAKPAPVKPGSKGTVTMAQVDALARDRGLTRAEALRFAESQGYAVAKTAPAKPAPSVEERWRKGLSGQSGR